MAVIAHIQTWRVDYEPLGYFKFLEGPRGARPHRPTVVIKITADDGTVGWGQSVPTPRWSYETPESVQSTIQHYLGPELLGVDVFDTATIEHVLSRNIAPSFSTGQPICKAGIDLALFDLTGKILGKLATERWKRKGKDSVTLSWTINVRSLAEAEQEVANALSQGYEHFNIKVAPDPNFDLELCALVKRLAPRAFIWVDANGGYTEADALTAAPRFADLGIPAFEQPLAANRLGGYRKLKQQGAVPILMDEGIVSWTELNEFIELGLLDGVAVKVARVGGLTEARRQIETLLDKGLLFYASGLTDPDISLAASLLLFGAYELAIPAALNAPQYLKGSLLRVPFTPQKGILKIPAGAGLGINVDETTLTTSAFIS